MSATSTVTVWGATMPLRDGHVQPDPDIYGRWYVGGQSVRSRQVAWWLIENALDADPTLQVPDHGTIGRCASGRFGNCLSVDLSRTLGAREHFWCASAFEPDRPCAVLRGRAPVWELYDLTTGKRLPTPVFGLLDYHDARARLQLEAERQGYYLSSWSDGDDRSAL